MVLRHDDADGLQRGDGVAGERGMVQGVRVHDSARPGHGDVRVPHGRAGRARGRGVSGRAAREGEEEGRQGEHQRVPQARVRRVRRRAHGIHGVPRMVLDVDRVARDNVPVCGGELRVLRGDCPARVRSSRRAEDIGCRAEALKRRLRAPFSFISLHDCHGS